MTQIKAGRYAWHNMLEFASKIWLCMLINVMLIKKTCNLYTLKLIFKVLKQLLPTESN